MDNFPVLGSSLLEMLTFQILVCAHLRTQDCLFVVRGIQILCCHIKDINQKVVEKKKRKSKLKKDDLGPIPVCIPTQCLAFLEQMGISVLRAASMGNSVTKTDPSFTSLARSKTFLLPSNIRILHGHMTGNLYEPQ